MAAQIIDGKAIAEQIREEIKAEVAKLATCGVKPGVATILVGDDGGAQFYRGQIEKNTGTVGFNYFNHTLPAGTSEDEILDAHRQAQRRRRPCTASWRSCRWPARSTRTRSSTPSRRVKDLDCVNPANIGHVLLGDQLFAPATPSACIEILDREGVELQGLDVTIVNHSNIVGKPVALLCLNRNASVHVVHVFSKDVPAACREADVLICAAPVQNLIKDDMVKPGAVVIDVTTIRVRRQAGRQPRVRGRLRGRRQRHPGARRRGPRDQRHPAQERPRRLQGADGRRAELRRRRAAGAAALGPRYPPPAKCGSLAQREGGRPGRQPPDECERDAELMRCPGEKPLQRQPAAADSPELDLDLSQVARASSTRSTRTAT